jgi:hypothetical protein
MESCADIVYIEGDNLTAPLCIAILALLNLAKFSEVVLFSKQRVEGQMFSPTLDSDISRK